MPADSPRAIADTDRRTATSTEHSAARRKSVVREYGEALFVALLLALFIRSFVVQAFKIPSGSMIPTLVIGDHILVNKFVYGVHLPYFGTPIIPVGTPHRGDVVVFVYPQDEEKDFIKRVVGVAGDTIEVRDKRLYVNGEAVLDPYAHFAEEEDSRTMAPRDNFGPFQVPAGYIFAMGDNRDRSYDSRFWGPVALDKVKGKAFLIYWSWEGAGRWVRWERIGQLIY
jgi:signal peptidase I